MAIKLISTRDAALLQGVKCMVYGKAGAGKTRLCATAPSPVIISAEAGMLSLKDYNLPVIEITDITSLIEAHAWALGSAEAKQFASVCIDSVSEIGEVVLANAKKQVKDPRQAYGEMIEKMSETIRAFRDLKGKHVVMTAKQERIKDESTGLTLYAPSMPGNKLAQALPYFFDEVFHLDIGQTTDTPPTKYRYLRTSADFQYDAKDRSGCLDAIERPDLSYIIKKITGATS